MNNKTRRFLPIAVMRFISLSVVAVLALVFGVFGVNSESNTNSVNFSLVAQKMSTIKSYHVDGNANFSVDLGALNLSLTGNAAGDVNVETSQADLTASGSAMGVSVKGNLILNGSDLYVNVDVPGFPIFNPNDYYLINLSQFGSKIDNIARLVFEPGQVLQMLSRYGTVQDEGSVIVNGESATLFVANLDIQKLLSSANNKTSFEPASSVNGSATVDVWVNNDQEIAKESINISVTVDLSKIAKGNVQIPFLSGSNITLNGSATVNFSNFGEQVNIKIPPATSVVPFNQLWKSGPFTGMPNIGFNTQS